MTATDSRSAPTTETSGSPTVAGGPASALDAPVVWTDLRPEGPDAERHERLGEKGASVQTLAAAHLPTPLGFVVSAHVFDRSVDLAAIRHGLETVWTAAATADRGDVARLARKARHLVNQTVIARDDEAAIVEAIARLGDTQPVAVRSSAAPGAVSGPDCAGVHESFLGVVGPDAVIARIRSCWTSLFSERALLMRSRGLGAEWPRMAVLVQEMIRADVSGVCSPHGDDELLIEATFGLGEPIATGAAEPDRYLVGLIEATARAVEIGRKDIVLSGTDVVGHRFATARESSTRSLDDDRIDRVRSLARMVWTAFGGPQEVEFAFERDDLWLLQVRAVGPTGSADGSGPGLSGIGVGIGVATGAVRVIDSVHDIDELVDGEVLVTAATTPEWSPAFERACAVVTDAGDELSHTARIAREFGIPAVVGTGNASVALIDGQHVSVDASRGWIVPRDAPRRSPRRG